VVWIPDTVETDDGSRIPRRYGEYLVVFSKVRAEELPPHRNSDHAIDLEPGSKLPHGRIYNLSEAELAALKAYIETNLANGFIRRSTSPAAAPILFVKKKDGSLRLCVDYRALNKVTVKNRYPLPLISEMLDRVRGAKIFTKLDLRGAYNLIRIREGDEYKTAFRTRYGQFEYRVMPFGLTNAPATFQAYMDECLAPYIDDFAVCYLDDILIYSKDPREHEEHVCKVLAKLKEFGLYCKASKCEFSVRKVQFLGFVISEDGVAMEADRISTIEDWPAPKSVKDVQTLLGFTNFYRRFIRKYAKITAPISDLLKSTRDSRWEWTQAASRAFQKLKRAFTEAPILMHFDPERPITLQTDASGFAIAGILNQYDNFGTLRPVSFYSRKCSSAEQNYDTYDRELLAIVESFKHWRHYLEGAKHPILVRCDHKNLEYFQTSKVLSRRQARWYEILSAYNFTIEHLEGKKNPADGPSRRPDYEEGYQRPVMQLLASLATDPYENLLPDIKEAQKTDKLAQEMRMKLEESRAEPEGGELEGGEPEDGEPEEENQWEVRDGALTFEGRIYVPATSDQFLRTRVIRLFHDTPESGHFGILRTSELVARDFFWPGMEASVRTYVNGCETCNRIKAPRHQRYGKNMPIPPPERPWSGLAMDFVTDLPESTDSQYTSILVVVDRFTKMATYIPCRKDIDSPELARLFFERVICRHGVPDDIITDRGSQFTSRFWNRVCSYLSMDHRRSTAFHPQTDGQTERQNQTMEQYLRAYVNYEQDNWAMLLPLAEFAYNNTIHQSTRMTPFFANYGFHPQMQFKKPKAAARLSSEKSAEELVGRLHESHERLRNNLLEAQERQSRYAKGQEIIFNVGDKVWLSTRNIKSTRLSKKLDYKRIGPYRITQVINANAYRLELPRELRIHDVFHVSLLDRYTPPGPGQPQPEPLPTIAASEDTEEEWEVERILDSKRRYRKLHYLVQWAGYDYVRTSWEPAENLENASQLVEQFHRENPGKPRPDQAAQPEPAEQSDRAATRHTRRQRRK
jgi:RNase H-like domain found in reverse transcriptase/Reverse transcriptase (RNA-dependent DNA polymerase)/Integrase zinc binding domain/Chromo (CHRromatin Organisation MOdifier) domain/Integrase core domain